MVSLFSLEAFVFECLCFYRNEKHQLKIETFENNELKEVYK